MIYIYRNNDLYNNDFMSCNIKGFYLLKQRFFTKGFIITYTNDFVNLKQ